MVKEFNIFSTNDLEAFDLTVIFAYRTGRIKLYTEDCNNWKQTTISISNVKRANTTGNAIIKRIFNQS
jgi:hypothetical protein